jgi:integrase
VETKREARRAGVLFSEVVTDYLKVAERGFRNPRSIDDLKLLLEGHAKALSDRPVADVGTAHVEAALREMWLVAPKRAGQTLAAILRVLRFAKAKGLSSTSAAGMREDMTLIMPKGEPDSRHFPAMDYKKVPEFMQELRWRQAGALSPCAIEFVVLTACRANEVVGMKWSEVDWEGRVWTVPLERMKTRKKTKEPHRVPLSDRAVALLEQQRAVATGPYVWPGAKPGRPIIVKALYIYLTRRMGVPVSVHGFRSSFRDWAGDTTDFAREHIEASLSHAVGNAVERAYRRGDALEKRRVIMEAWGKYCDGEVR